MPPGLYPQAGPRPTTSRAEQALYRALGTGLPEGWTAWHSLRVRTGRGFEGEGDFVIAVPGRGVILLEVKGGALEVRDGQWLQNGRRLERMPREQALGFRATLLNKLKEGGLRELPFFAVAVAFPDTAFSVEPTQGDVQGALLGQQDLPYLSDALPELASRLLDGKRVPADDAWIAALHALWGHTWAPRLTLGDRVRLRADELLPLDADQVAVLDLVDENERLLVSGGPGTGKTLVARELCGRFEARGKRPVLLCSTRALATALRAGGLKNSWTVRQFAAELLEATTQTVQDGAPQEQWTAETWDRVPTLVAERGIEPVRELFDAVIVDEAQDLSDSDWTFVRALSDGRPLWAFMDEGQRFWDERQCPRELFPASFKLPGRYRCPDALARFADQYRAATAGAPPPPDGAFDELRVVPVDDEAALESAVVAEIHRARKDGARPEHIAVLSLGGQTRTTLCARGDIGGVPVVRADDPDAHDALVADTFLRFKGLERPYVIVTELARGTKKYDVRMHVALTRATVGCVVVATREAIAGDARLAGVLGDG